jgi:hypothetical protein
MLTDRNTFEDVRHDTYLLCVLNQELYYHYAQSYLRGVIRDFSSVSIDNPDDTKAYIDHKTAYLRRLHTHRTALATSRVRDELTPEQLARFLSATCHVRAHSPTQRTVTLPVTVETFRASKIAADVDFGYLPGDATSLYGTDSAYMTPNRVAQLIGGRVIPNVLARGDGLTSLQSALESFTQTSPRTAALLTADDAQFVVPADASGYTHVLGHLADVGDISAWSLEQARVIFPQNRVGATGPLFEHELSTKLIDLDVGLGLDMYIDNARVTRVMGERVALSAPMVVTGDTTAEYRSHVNWGACIKRIPEVTLVGTTEVQRRDALRAELAKLIAYLKAMLSCLGTCTEPLKSEIRAAHYSVGADHAYNLLEQGALIEYHQLTEQTASMAAQLARAAEHIKAGSRL